MARSATRSLQPANKPKLQTNLVFPPAPRCCRPNRSHYRQHKRKCYTRPLRLHDTAPDRTFHCGRYCKSRNDIASAVTRFCHCREYCSEICKLYRRHKVLRTVSIAGTRGLIRSRCHLADLFRVAAQFAVGYVDQLNSHEAKETNHILLVSPSK